MASGNMFKVFISNIFSLCDLDMHGTKTIRTIIKEGHVRIIPASLVEIPPVV